MKNTKNKGFTKVELIAVIAIVAVLAATLIPTFLSLAKNNDMQEQMQEELDNLAQQIENNNSISLEEIEAKIAAQIAGIQLPEGVDADDVNKAIADAIAGIKIPEGGLTDAQVQEIINNAIKNLKLPEAGISAADVEKIVNDAIAGIKLPEGGLSSDEIKAIVSDALKGVSSGLSSADVQKIVDAAIAGLKLPEAGLSAEEVEKIIADAIAGIKPEGGLTAEQIEKIIADAIAGIKIPEAGPSTADVEKMINDAIAAALQNVKPGVTDAELKAAIEAAIKAALAQLGDTYLTEEQIQELINKALENLKPEDTQPEAPVATQVVLNPTYIELPVGTAGHITASVFDQYGNFMPNAVIRWTTTNAVTAFVNNGSIFAIAPGSAVITATVEGTTASANCFVVVSGTVIPPEPQVVPVQSVMLNPTAADLTVGETTTLTATVLPANANNKLVKWTTSNAAVATVENGKVTAVGAGTAIITVTTVDGNKSAICAITVKAAAPESVTVTVGSVAEFANALTDPTVSKIVLGADVKLTEALEVTRDLVIDLNGKKLTPASGLKYPAALILSVAKDCELTIKDGTIVNNATKLNGGMDFIRVSNGAVLNLDNVNVAIIVTPEVTWNNTMNRWQMNSAEHHIITIASNATANLNNCNITVASAKAVNAPDYTRNMTVVGVFFNKNSTGAKLVMNGGSFSMEVTEPLANKNTDALHFIKAERVDAEATNTVEINGTKVSVGGPNVAGTINSTNYLFAAQYHWVSPNYVYSGVDTVKLNGVSFTISGEIYTLKAAKTYVTKTSEKILKALIKDDCNVEEIKYHFICTDRAFGCAYEADLTIKEIAKIAETYGTKVVDGITHADCPKCKYGVLIIGESTIVPPVITAQYVTLDKTALDLTVGDEATLKATVSPSNAVNKAVTWATSNPAVATVENGKVIAVGAGTAIITVTTVDNGITATCVVTVKAPVASTVVANSVSELANAINNPTVGTIILGADVKLTEALDVTRDLVIDLNGKKLTPASGLKYPAALILSVAKDCELTIKDGTIVNNATKLNGGMDFIRVSNGAVLNLDNVNVAIIVTPEVTWNNTMNRWQMNSAEHHIITIASNATANLNNCNITVASAKAVNAPDYTRNMTVVGVFFNKNSTGAKLVMNGGSFSMEVTEPLANKNTDALHFIKAERVDAEATNTVEINGTKVSVGGPNVAGTINSTNYLFAAQYHWVSPNYVYSGVDTVKLNGVSFTISGEIYTLKAAKTYVTKTSEKILKALIKDDCNVEEIKYHFICTDRAFGCAYEADLTIKEIAKIAETYGTKVVDGITHADCPKCKYGVLIIGESTIVPPVITAQYVTLDKTALDLTVGDEATLKATVSPSNAVNKAVTWATSNPAVATVENGKVIAVGAGNAIITVTTVDNGITATCVVTVKEVVVPVTGITVKQSVSITEGKTYMLTATVLPENATNKNVTWKSSNTKVATVDENGKITAVSKGTALITVTTEDGNFSAQCKVTVKVATVAVTGVTLDKETATLEIGQTTTLTATVLPATATTKTVTWTSDNEAVAIVDANGNVSAVGVGTATITVTTKSGSKTATCVVTVKEATVAVTGVTLNRDKTSTAVGKYVTLIATILPEDATNKKVTWTSSDTSIATVDSKGRIKGIAPGVATITVTTDDGNFKASAIVTIVPVVTEITLDKTAITLEIGQTDTIIAKVVPNNATSKSITWSSSDVSVATVDSNGTVVAVAPGTATITALNKFTGITATCVVTVKAPAPVVETMHVGSEMDLTDAIEIPSVKTIVLTEDITLTDGFTVSKDLTIDLNGNKFIPVKEIVYPESCIISVAKGCEVVVKNGVINDNTRNLDSDNTFFRVPSGSSLVLENVVVNITVNPKIFFNNTMDRWQMNSAENSIFLIGSDASVTLINTDITVVAPKAVNISNYTRNMTIIGVNFNTNSSNSKFVMEGGSFSIKVTDPKATRNTDTIEFIRSKRSGIEATNTVEIKGNAQISIGGLNAAGARNSINMLYLGQTSWDGKQNVDGGLASISVESGCTFNNSLATYIMNVSANYITKDTQSNLDNLIKNDSIATENVYHFICSEGCGYEVDLTVAEAEQYLKESTVTIDGVKHIKCPKCTKGGLVVTNA